jgi:predicted lipoprotein with Yx(FWY)xxD motif
MPDVRCSTSDDDVAMIQGEPMLRTDRRLIAFTIALVFVLSLGLLACSSDSSDPGAESPDDSTPADVETDDDDEVVEAAEPDEGEQDEVDGEVAPDVGSRTTGIGTLLVDADGLTLYVTSEDGPEQSQCTDECTDTWIPYTVEVDDPIVANNVDGDLVSTFEREDGTLQVAMDGHPLYRYAGDEEPTDTNGQEVGGIWFIIGPDGSVGDDGNLTIDTHGDIYDY